MLWFPAVPPSPGMGTQQSMELLRVCTSVCTGRKDPEQDVEEESS